MAGMPGLWTQTLVQSKFFNDTFKAGLPGELDNNMRRRRRTRDKTRGFVTLVHVSARPKPFWSHLPVSPCLIDWGNIMHPTYPANCA